MSTLKEKAASFLLSKLGKTATVNDVNHVTDTLVQVSLQLPDALNWRSCQHLKCETTKLAMRDYTVANFDAATNTATLLIHAGHNGMGGQWAQSLEIGQSVLYMGPGGGAHQPTGSDNLVCIGDMSAIGHFTSLHTRKNKQQQFHTMIITPEKLPASVLGTPITTGREDQVANWLQSLPLRDTTFYVAGNIPLVVRIRKIVKELGWKQIKSTGFWE